MDLSQLSGYLEQLKGLLTFDNLKYAIGLFVLLWVVVTLNKKLRLLDRLSLLARGLFGAQVGNLSAKWEARKAEQSGDWLAAGLHYDQVGDWERALD